MNVTQILEQITSLVSTNGWIAIVGVVLLIFVYSIIKKTLKISILALLAVPLSLLLSRLYTYFIFGDHSSSLISLILQWKVLDTPNEYVLLILVIGFIVMSEMKCLGFLISIVATGYAFLRYFLGENSLPDLLVPTFIAVLSIFIARRIFAKVR
ncbi:hypothetical protein IPJ91_01040 [bacterium]|nr:MAG: hypothetical protein IPJ91_01040 [bacterium]